MPYAWGGADPANVVDASPYEMGTEQQANQEVTLTGVRIWGDNSTVTGREARIWNSLTGTVLATIDLPDSLPAGWSDYSLDVPIQRLTGQRWLVSFHTGGNYGAISGALTSDVLSADSAVTSLASASATNGNGVFSTAPGSFPSQTFGSTFYGIDTMYELGSDASAPVIEDVAVTIDGLDVTLTVAASDPDGLSGAVYGVRWGDGESDSGPSATLAHTFTSGGTYALLISVTDSTGLTDYAAVSVTVLAPVPRVGDPVVMPLAEKMLVCLDQEISKVASPPRYVQLRPGLDVDHLLSTAEDECCEGLAWVRVVSFGPSSGVFPALDESPPAKGTASWAVTLELGVIRCAPTPDGTSIPTGDEWYAVVQAVMDDAAAMRRAVCCFTGVSTGRVRSTLPGTWNPLAVQGGCVGGVMTVTVRGPACDCSEAGPVS